MKHLFCALVLSVSGSVFAQRFPNPYPLPQTPVMPRLYNYGHSVEIQAWNHNRMGVMCSGRVDLRLASGQPASAYVSMYVPANGFRNHRIGLTDPRNRIVSANHSIWCN